MVDKAKQPRRKPAQASLPGQRPIRNAILAGLPQRESTALFSKLEFVQLPTRHVLHEMAEPIPFAYFIEDGVASVINVLPDGRAVEWG